MWEALGIISVLVLLAAVIGVIVGLIIGVVRKRWIVLKWSAVTGGVAFVLLILVATTESEGIESENSGTAAQTSSSTDNAKPQSPSTPVPTAIPLPKVSASSLAQAYEANEVAANIKYEGKVALVTGEVHSITDARGKYDVKLLTGDVWTHIVCKVEISEVDSVTAVGKGQVITVLGNIKGKAIVDIVVEPCAIQQ